MQGRIFDIKRFAVHDGNGIRTTVFFKGCPLKCVWCHNPEGISFMPQIGYFPYRCLNCGSCLGICSAHKMEGGIHKYSRERCSGCGKCESRCPGGALTFFGKTVTVESLMPRLLEDRDFYETSGGGVTLSGGECLCQADFCAALLKRLKREGIHTAVDTCGFVEKNAIDKVLPYTDLFLYDVKAIDEDVHIKCTGQSNKLILENLNHIDQAGGKIEIRVPLVPEMNENQLERIYRYTEKLHNLTKIKVLPYHDFAGSKYEALGMKNTLPKIN